MDGGFDASRRGRPFAGTERFTPIAFLGRGNMGFVYRVRDAETGEDVALKTLHDPTPDEVLQLKQEFRVLADITHYNLVRLHELFVDARHCFFTMELVEGVDLVSALREDAPAGAEWTGDRLHRLLAVARQLVRGLAAVHAAGKVHRDVKPSNVLVTRDARVVLLDFGLAVALRRDDGVAPAAGGMSGTLAYMAPERWSGAPPHPAADWYSIGVLLYEVLSGRLPFDDAPLDGLAGRRQPASVADHVPAVPVDLAALVTALLHPDPGARPGAAEILARLAESALRGEAEPALSPPLTATPFVGRSRELTELQAAFEEAQGGTPAVVHVVGPSGIGKTELVQRFLAWLQREERALVLRGRCHPQEAVPYKALDGIVDQLSTVLATLPPDRAPQLAAPGRGALARLFPVLTRVLGMSGDGELGDVDPIEQRREGVQALRALFAHLTASHPVVLWVDDLQWSDVDSGVLLRELLQPPAVPPLLLLFAYRDSDRERIPALGPAEGPGFTVRTPTTRVIELQPLSPDESEHLATLLCPEQTRSQYAPWLDEARGSPFLLNQLVYRAAATQAAAMTAGAPRLSTVIADRVAGLGAASRELLEIVSIAGRPIERSVALRAASLLERDRSVALDLEHGRLLRSSPAGGSRELEVYHDRIRELVVAALPPARAAARHRQLAETLRSLANADPEELFVHYLAAEEPLAAVPFGVAAAERAAQALAFERAAQLYRQVLDLPIAAAARGALLTGLAEALVNCGHSGAAGETFVAAAGACSASPTADIASLRQRAAEHYVRAGRLAEGVGLTRALLADMGVVLPTTPRRLLAMLVTQRLRLWWRGERFTPCPPEELPAPAMRRLETFWKLAIALSPIDQMMSDILSVRHLREALDLGAAQEVGRGFAVEATKSAQVGGRMMRRRSRRLRQAAEAILGGDPAPYDQALMGMHAGTLAYEETAWRRSYEACTAAGNIARAHCPGTTFEVITSEAFALSALAHMGELRQLGPRVQAAVADGVARGDAYAVIGFSAGILNLVWLAADQPDRARQVVREAMARWPVVADFHVQHYLELIADVHIDLYIGDPQRAWRRLEAAWPRARRAQLLRMDGPAVELYNLRARAALAAALRSAGAIGAAGPPSRRGDTRRRLLRAAAADAMVLRRRSTLSAQPLAMLLGAGLQAAAGQRAAAIATYRSAAEALEAVDMRLHAAAAKLRAGALLGGAEGGALEGAAVEWIRGQGVARPSALAAVFAP